MTDGIEYYGIGDVHIGKGTWKNYIEVKFDTTDRGMCKITYNKESGVRPDKDLRLTKPQNEYIDNICLIVWMITFETDKKAERFE